MSTLEEMSTKGVLWYINRVAFHPRGLTFELDPGNAEWRIRDHGEIMVFSEESDDAKFKAFNEYLRTVEWAS